MNEWQLEKKLIAHKLIWRKLYVTVLLLFETISTICIAYVIQALVNAFVGDEKYLTTSLLVAVILSLIVQGTLVFFANKSFNNLGTKARELVRDYCFRMALKNYVLINQFQTGDLLSRLFTDAGDMGERLGQRAVLFFAGFFQTAIVLSLLFYYNWITALCITIIYPIYSFFGIRFLYRPYLL